MVGIGFSGTIEAGADKLGLPSAKLTAGQTKLKSAKFAVIGGNIIGIMLGCLLGMFPLLFLGTGEEEENRRLEKYLNSENFNKQCHRRFQRYDINNDGVLNKNELRDAVEDVRGSALFLWASDCLTSNLINIFAAVPDRV